MLGWLIEGSSSRTLVVVAAATFTEMCGVHDMHVFVCSCSCPVGFEGARCQQTKVTFTGNNGYVVLKSLESYETDKLSFEFMTTTSTGSQLMLYTGPISDPRTLNDFMSIELVSGYPRLRISLGDGEVMIPETPPSLSLSDGNWHSVEVFRNGKVSYSTLSLHSIDYVEQNEYNLHH